MYTQDRCQRHVHSGQVMTRSLQWVPEVLILEEEALEKGEILHIIDASQRYSYCVACFSIDQADRLPKHSS